MLELRSAALTTNHLAGRQARTQIPGLYSKVMEADSLDVLVQKAKEPLSQSPRLLLPMLSTSGDISGAENLSEPVTSNGNSKITT